MANSARHRSPDGPPDPAEIQRLWDERYAQADQVWSGNPNDALVAEAATLAPGSALDVGCGEGADSIWLARNGWQVSALDPSGVALDRARAAGDAAQVSIEWLHSGLIEAALPAGGFDLVIALYPALIRTADDAPVRALLAAVAEAGTLLFVHHAQFGTQVPDPGDQRAHDHQHDREGISPADFVGVADVRAALEAADAGWSVDVQELRPRTVAGGSGAHHTQDIVLRARRMAAASGVADG